MKNKFSNVISLMLILILIAVSLSSCDEGGDPDASGTTTQEFAGDWFVIGYEPDGVTPAFNQGYHVFSTYNAASNDENFWIDDHGSFFEIKTKVQAEFDNYTFTGPTDAEELITGGTVTVSNGKIIKLGGEASASKTVVDSIYFEAEFDWDLGIVYKFGGHRRTGFLEDEH